MRDIKFRAWYTPFKNKKFGAGYKYGNSVISFHNMSPDKYELEQFTGLKDKKGVDIYENDVLKSFGGNTEVVIYIDGRFEPVCWYDEKTYEVIGNIHENADLLEETT